MTQKLGKISKIQPTKFSSLRISGHLPAPVANGRWDRPRTSAIFRTSEAPWPWPWIGSCSIPSCISHRPLSTNRISLKSEKLFRGRTNCRDPSKFKVTWPKTRTNIKNPDEQIKILCCSLRISGHLPAPIVNDGGDRLRKVQFSELQKRRDLDLGLGYTAHRRASVIDLGKTFCERTYGRTYWRMDISPSNIIWSTRRSRPNNLYL